MLQAELIWGAQALTRPVSLTLLERPHSGGV